MSSSSFRVESGCLYIGGDCIDLPCTVGDVIVCGGLIVVRVEPPVGVILNRNVFAYTKEGRLLWRIEESPHGTEVDKPYVKIFLDVQNRLVAGNWNGVDYLVGCDDGSIIAKAFNK